MLGDLFSSLGSLANRSEVKSLRCDRIRSSVYFCIRAESCGPGPCRQLPPRRAVTRSRGPEATLRHGLEVVLGLGLGAPVLLGPGPGRV